MSLQACPACASQDLVTVEIAEDAADDVLECEDCGESFRGDELP